MDIMLKNILEEIYVFRSNMNLYKNDCNTEIKTGYQLALYDLDELITIIEKRFNTYNLNLKLYNLEDVAYEMDLLSNFIRNYKPIKRKIIGKSIKENIFKKYKNKCIMCKSNINLEIDHIIPISRGGTDNIKNLQLLCKDCNLKKSNKILKNDNT